MPQKTPAEKTEYMREYYKRPGKLAKKRILEKKWYVSGGKSIKNKTNLKRKYGIDGATYEKMLNAQDGVCIICKRPERRMIRGSVTALMVDHNHTTGQVRDLLCGACNSALGLLDENPDRMRQLAAYIDKWTGSN